MGQVSMQMCKRVEFRRYPSVLSFLLILGSACYILAPQPAEAQTFTVHELTLGGSQCKVEAISNGRAVGWATTPGDAEIHAFTWTEAGGMVDLGTLGGTRAGASAVDGDRVVGFSLTKGNAESHAFSWTPTEGMRDLGTLGGTHSGASGVSGGEVVGESTTASGEIHAFRWTAVGGMVDLGTLSGGTQSSAVKIHQGLVAGWSTTSGDAIRTRRPVAWNAAGEIIDIVGEPFDLLSGGFVRGNGEAVDVRDGVVIGHSRISTPDLEEHAFAWTAATGKVDLGTLPGDNVSFAHGTSNGQVVGFSSRFQGGSVGHAFSWTPSGGMIDLGTLGGHAEATHVNSGKVVGLFLDVVPSGPRAFLWTVEDGMVNVTPPDFTTGARPVGIDAAGRIAVTDDNTDIGIARSAVLVPIPGLIMVNDRVLFDPHRSTFSFTPTPKGCPAGFVGTFSFEARLRNRSVRPLTDLFVQVRNLTNGTLLQNADGGPGGIGARLTVPQADGFSDGVLGPRELVDVPFVICLTKQEPFTFVVDVLGAVE